MRVIETEIPDVRIYRPDVFHDDRGFFLETWNRRAFAAAGFDAEFVQDNQSHSRRGTLRGLHYQIRSAQGKLVRVGAGKVFDVCVDLRRSSPRFGRWVGVVLSADKHDMLFVPPEFAHGFLVLSDSADFHYKCTDYHAPEHERAIRWDDPDLAIDWPLPEGKAPLLSPRDRAAGSFRDAECFP
jgi:dTDP-4-dehydrorhamnose 3,5-epimerase